MADEHKTPAKTKVAAKRPPASKRSKQDVYWRRNLLYLVLLLTVWFIVSYGCGILFVEQLNRFKLPGSGFKLGFWFAQQGSIYVFVLLIVVYVWLMNRLDREFDVGEEMAPDHKKES